MGITYRNAGVDIDLESEAIGSLVAELTYRRHGSLKAMGGTGHFAGLMSFGSKTLGLTVDGVGTKMLIADALCDWTTVGIDCIAMNVNDLYVMNLEPVAFVDYVATDRLDSVKMAQIGKGLNEGARQANIDIVGGETATLKGLVTGLDLAGTCLGIQDRDQVINGSAIRPGDQIIGVSSTGVHSNGLTLARKVVEEFAGYKKEFSDGRSFGEELLTPTRIYHESLRVSASCTVHGMCHITGGGLLNFTRLSRFGFSFDHPLPPQEIFRWMQDAGGIETREMYRTFNMGMGYAYIVPKEEVPKVTAIVPGSAVVGSIIEETGVFLEGRPFT
ncbi:MAG: phosphoribosylformylglycinamidine cyclo-ligase [Methanoregulaceae archaeon]|nr:phosphoribosylformylglycinamidine cyclo-ligase [Methanoregulaceae archaeon]